MIELAQEFDLHPNQIKQWRDHLIEGVTGIFGEALKAEPEPITDVKSLHAKIGNRSHWCHWFEPMAEALKKMIFCPARDTLRGERHWFKRTEQGSVAERKK